jgi:hypothetical protein
MLQPFDRAKSYRLREVISTISKMAFGDGSCHSMNLEYESRPGSALAGKHSFGAAFIEFSLAAAKGR